MVVAVLPKAYAGDPPPWLFQSDIERLLISVGGKERGDSVRHGMEDLPPEVEIVVIHDAARPLVTNATIDAVIAAARRGTGAVAALPVVDTLKRVGQRLVDQRNCGPRAALARADTAGLSSLDDRRALTSAPRRRGSSATDDAALCERLGHRVVVVPGSERAIKITTEEDFARAEALSMLPE